MTTYKARTLTITITFIIASIFIADAAVSLVSPAITTSLFTMIISLFIMGATDLNKKIEKTEFNFRLLCSGILIITNFILCDIIAKGTNVSEVMWGTLFSCITTAIFMFNDNE